MTISLRRFAGASADAEMIFDWRNDPQTRAVSRSKEPLGWEAHLVWLEHLQRDPRRLQFVAEVEGTPVGAIRFDRARDEANVHVMVAPRARGRGLGTALIQQGLAAVRAAWPDVVRAVALIYDENERSLRAFARAGFERQRDRDAGEPGLGVYTRALQPTLDLRSERPLVVAELSANHGGSLSRAVDTIAAAAEAGADAIKIQTYTPDTMTLASDRPEFRIKGGLWDGRTLHDLYREAHTPWEWHAELKSAANAAGLPLFSTPFDASAVRFLDGLGVPAYKVASFEVTDLELVRAIAATGKPIVMSTGMATLAEIDEAVRTIREAWQGRDPGLVLLKCVSAYPAEPRQMNLRCIPHLGQAFGALPGLSDHTLGSTVAVAAAALGARLIEKHFILRRADGGPDSAFSLEPAELRALVTAVREASEALGQIQYGPGEGEKDNLLFRRSLFLAADVKAGEPFTRDNVRVIRPGHGLPPRTLPLVLGRHAARDAQRGEPLRWEHVGG